MAKQINVLALIIIFFAVVAYATDDSNVGPHGSDEVNEDLKRLKEEYGDDITITPGGGIVSNVPFEGAPDDWFKPIEAGSDGLYDSVPVAYEDYAMDLLTPAPAPSNVGLEKYYINY